jgi:sugar phosphate isomerase/epimerase
MKMKRVIDLANIGIRLHDTIEGSFEEKTAFIKTQGFSHIHLALSKVGMPSKPADLTPDYADSIKNILGDTKICVLGCYKNLGAENFDSLKKEYEANIIMGKTLGAAVVGTESATEADSLNHSEESYNRVIKNIAALMPAAEESGVFFAVEPVYKHIIWNTETALKMLRDIRSDNLKIIFDPVNLLDISNIDDRDRVFAEFIDKLGEYIKVIHIKDFIKENGGLKSVGAGFGEMGGSFKNIIKFAGDLPISLENTTPETAEISLNTIRSLT